MRRWLAGCPQKSTELRSYGASSNLASFHRLTKRFTPNFGVRLQAIRTMLTRSRYTNSCCYQVVFWRRFHWLLRRSERLCLLPRSTLADTTSCLLPWPAYAFCWAGLLMPRARRACSLRSPRTTSRAFRAPGGPGPMPSTWSLTATRARPLAPTATWR